MSWRQKFLVLSPTPTWPLDHGNRKRVHQVCTELMRAGHEVHFLFYPSEEDWADNMPRNALERMRGQWTEVHLVAPTRPLHAAARGAHHELDEWWDPAIGDMLRWLFRIDQFDGLIVNYVWLSKAFESAPDNVLKIIDTHDKVGGRKELLASQGLPPEFFYLKEEDEIAGLNRADVVLAIKDEEAKHFRANCAPDVDVVTLPYAEEAPAAGCISRQDPGRPIRFGLLGARNNLNRRSVEELLHALADRHFPASAPCRIVIAGGMSDEFQDCPHDAVDIMGRVEEVGLFYASCDLVVVPLASSTGQKIRVGEALAFGKPLIAHAHAFEGYEPTDEMHSLASVDAVADAILSVTRDPNLVGRLRHATVRAHALQRARVDQAIAGLIQRSRRSFTVTCFPVNDELLRSQGAPWMRLRAATKAAARYGRALVWLSVDEITMSDCQRLRSLAGWTSLCSSRGTSVQLLRIVSTDAWGHLLIADSLEDCIARCEADVVWTEGAETIASFDGETIIDADLASSRPIANTPPRNAVRVSSIPHAEREARYTPFLLGQSAVPVWRKTGARPTVWIVDPDANLPLGELAEILARISGNPVGYWTEAAGAPAPPPNFHLLSRHMLPFTLARPELAIINRPAALSDPLPLALLAEAGAQCIEVDQENRRRFRRRLWQCCDYADLLHLMGIWAETLRLGANCLSLGQTLRPELFAYSELVTMPGYSRRAFPNKEPAHN